MQGSDSLRIMIAKPMLQYHGKSLLPEKVKSEWKNKQVKEVDSPQYDLEESKVSPNLLQNFIVCAQLALRLFNWNV